MKPKVWIAAGLMLVTVSIIGLTLALGSLASIPSTQRQLHEVLPGAETAIAQAGAISRDKSHIGIGVGLTTLVCGILCIRRGRRLKRALDSHVGPSDDHVMQVT